MKVTVIGGAGRIGSKVVRQLQDRGVDTHPADLNTGVNALTGEGLAESVTGSSIVIDVSDAPSFAGDAPLEFFRTATANILAAGVAAGVKHHVVLSIVGVDSLDAGYFKAKVAQEQLIASSSIPYSIVHATQFYEFLGRIADLATTDGVVRLPSVLVQPMAADDVAAAIAQIALGEPVNGVIEVGGPEQFRLDQVVQRSLAAEADGRRVVADDAALYVGATLQERSLVPNGGAMLAPTRYDDWLQQRGRGA